MAVVSREDLGAHKEGTTVYTAALTIATVVRPSSTVRCSSNESAGAFMERDIEGTCMPIPKACMCHSQFSSSLCTFYI